MQKMVKISNYMYCLVPEKPLRLVYGTFYLAIKSEGKKGAKRLIEKNRPFLVNRLMKK